MANSNRKGFNKMYSKLLLIIALFVSHTFAAQTGQRKTADTDSSQYDEEHMTGLKKLYRKSVNPRSEDESNESKEGYAELKRDSAIVDRGVENPAELLEIRIRTTQDIYRRKYTDIDRIKQKFYSQWLPSEGYVSKPSFLQTIAPKLYSYVEKTATTRGLFGTDRAKLLIKILTEKILDGTFLEIDYPDHSAEMMAAFNTYFPINLASLNKLQSRLKAYCTERGELSIDASNVSDIEEILTKLKKYTDTEIDEVRSDFESFIDTAIEMKDEKPSVIDQAAGEKAAERAQDKVYKLEILERQTKALLPRINAAQEKVNELRKFVVDFIQSKQIDPFNNTLKRADDDADFLSLIHFNDYEFLKLPEMRSASECVKELKGIINVLNRCGQSLRNGKILETSVQLPGGGPTKELNESLLKLDSYSIQKISTILESALSYYQGDYQTYKVQFPRSQELKSRLRGSVEEALNRINLLRRCSDAIFSEQAYEHVDADIINVILEMLSPFTDAELLDLECEFEDYNERYFKRNGIISDEVAKQIEQKINRVDAYNSHAVHLFVSRRRQIANEYIAVVKNNADSRSLLKMGQALAAAFDKAMDIARKANIKPLETAKIKAREAIAASIRKLEEMQEERLRPAKERSRLWNEEQNRLRKEKERHAQEEEQRRAREYDEFIKNSAQERRRQYQENARKEWNKRTHQNHNKEEQSGSDRSSKADGGFSSRDQGIVSAPQPSADDRMYLTEAVREDFGVGTELERFGAADFNHDYYKYDDRRIRDLALRILGLEQSASKEEITKRYKKLSLVYHPDKMRENASKANYIFQIISNAYDVVK